MRDNRKNSGDQKSQVQTHVGRDPLEQFKTSCFVKCKKKNNNFKLKSKAILRNIFIKINELPDIKQY